MWLYNIRIIKVFLSEVCLTGVKYIRCSFYIDKRRILAAYMILFKEFIIEDTNYLEKYIL